MHFFLNSSLNFITGIFQRKHMGPKCEASQRSLSSECEVVILAAGESVWSVLLLSILILRLRVAFRVVSQDLTGAIDRPFKRPFLEYKLIINERQISKKNSLSVSSCFLLSKERNKSVHLLSCFILASNKGLMSNNGD